MIPNDLQQIVSLHLSTQAALHIHTGCRQHTWVSGETPSRHHCSCSSNPARESLSAPTQKQGRIYHAIPLKQSYAPRIDWWFICRNKHTNSIMPSLFPPQWEPYSGLNLQKAFLVFLKINPSSLEAFVTIKLSLFLFHLAVPSLKPSTLTGLNCCCFWIMLSYLRPHVLWWLRKMCTVILNILKLPFQFYTGSSKFFR